MSTALALRLIASGAVSAADAEAAMLSSLARRVPFVRALIDAGAIGEAVLDQELEQLGGIALRQVTGMPELVNRLPPHFCRRMGVLPVRVDHAARIVEVAAADPLDSHIPAEVAFHLGVPCRVLRAPISAIEDAIRRIELEAEAAAGRTRRATPPFPHGAPESSVPPPPPPEPAPIPLVRRTGGGDKPPDTLRLYKATLRPGALDGDAAAASAAPARDGTPVPPESEAPPVPLRTPRPPDAAEPAPLSEPPPRTLRGAAPRAPNPATDRPAPESSRAPAPESVRGPESTRPRSARDSTPRLRDLIDQPPPMDRLRDSTPRLRDLAAALTRETAARPEGAAPADDTAPVSSIVPQDAAPPAEPPAVSFPSLPPPSVMDQPALLAADEEWLAPVPAAPAPEPPARPRRPPSRFARPAIDIQLPQPPSERARKQRTIWDVPLGGGDGGAEVAPDAPTATTEAPEPLRAPRGETLDTSAVLEALRAAGSRDDVVVAALRGLRTVGRRAAIFIVRRDGFHGWACNVELGDQEQLRRISVPHDAPSLFATAVATGSYFGPIPVNAVHASLLAVLEHPSSDVAVAVARAGGKPVMVLFADDLVDIKRRVLPRLTELSDAVGAALSRLLAARL